mgnify:CR=1 FL=1
MKQIALALVVAAAIAAAALWPDNRAGQSEPQSRPPVPVSLWEVKSAAFSDEASALGSLRAWESIVVTASVSDRVVEVHFEDGDTVEAGAPLVTLRQDEQQAALREQQELAADAQREVRRLTDLAKRNQVAQTDLDSVRTQAAIARHKIDEMRSRIADRNIKAPFPGVLGLREVSPGALVSPGQQITTLDDLSRMRLDFSVPATMLSFLQVGMQISARTPAFNRQFEGQLSAIDARVDPATRSVTARATIENPDGLLRPGMLMEVSLRATERNVLLLPEESLQSRSTRHFVWVIEGDKAKRTEITLGARKPGWVEITGGVTAGAQVVRDGVRNLRGTEANVSIVEP